ncbi:MAG TPA: NUDIX domain-containing protein [Rhizomicrobium sp.]|jgi:ADP-ribose pyrophosphatase YjhB (NUDIX family)
MVTNPLQAEPKALSDKRSLAQNLMLAARLTTQAIIAPVAFGAHAMVEDGEGRLLLVRHTYMPGWHFPGGGVNRGEAAANAVIRELQEEIGLATFARCDLFGLYTRKHFWTTNVIALFHMTGAAFDFKPNAEIAEAKFYPPSAPPDGIGGGALRRFKERAEGKERNLYW